MIFDRQGLCLFTNNQGLHMMDLPALSVKEAHFREIWPEDQRPRIDAYVDQVLRGTSCTFDMARMNGPVKSWWRVSLSPISGDAGEIEGYIAISMDITAVKEADERLKKANEILEQEVERRTHSLRQAYEELLASKEDLRLTAANLHTTIENLPFDFFALDDHGTYFMQNKICRSHWGNVIGKKPDEVAPDPETLAFWLDNNRRALSGEVVNEQIEYVVHGERRYVFSILGPIVLDDRIQGIVGFNIDITEMARAEKELDEKDAILRSIERNLPGIMIYQVVRPPDGSRRFTYVSDSVRRFYGCSPEAAKADPGLIYGRVHEEDRQRVLEEEEAANASLSPFRSEIRMINPDGNIRWSHFESRPRKMADGSTVWDGVEIDISERKLTEQALLESRRRLKTIFDSVPDAIFQTDCQGRITLINRTVPGIRLEQFIGSSVFDWVPQDQRQVVREALEQVIRTGKPQIYESNGPGPHGTLLLYEVRVMPVVIQEAVESVIFIATDITSRRVAEKLLHKSEANLRKAEKIARVGNWEYNVVSGELTWSDEVYRIYALDPVKDMPTYEDVVAAIIPEDRARFQKAVDDAVQKGLPFEGEYRMTDRDGRERYIHSIGEVLRDNEGRPLTMFGIVQDITERKKAEAALLDSERKYRSIIESTDTGFVILDDRGRVIDANQEYARLSGHSAPAEILGRPVTEWTAAHDHERNRAEVEKCVRQGFVRNLEIDYVDKTGRITPVEISATVIETSGGINIFSLCREITARREAEAELQRHRNHLEELVEERTRELTALHEQLRQSQKLEAVGLLAGGIAHDFSNVLAAIKGSMYLIQKKAEKDSPVMKYADQVVKSISRANSLTQGLLAFSRRQMVVLMPRDLNGIVRDMASLLSQVMGEHIELQVLLTDKEPSVMADTNQIEQVLLNLATNARDAMPDGGTLRIETAVMEMDEPFLREHGFGSPGKYALITVTDSGTGISEDIREKIFEPFFTTKDTGKGTGLGLAVTYGIIKQHKGYISAASSLERGTTFRIYLPVTDAGDTKAEAGALLPAASGSETILFAEDDPDARKTTAEILKMSGYLVVEAKDGENALRVFREHKNRIGLVMLDVKMPGKNGREVYEAIRNSGSDVKVLFVSGYSDNIMDESVVRGKNVDFLSKTALPEEMLRKIREMLDR